jgi:3-dehydroquinate synthase
LPQRELSAGLAEVVKYGLICDRPFFDWIDAHTAELLALEPDAIARAVRRSCEIKAEIVARDEHERGDRALLNLGHTFGHAIETVTGYSRWLHGEAVGAGLMMAATMSRHAGWMSVADCDRIADVLARLHLPTHAKPEVGAEQARAAMSIDKKVKEGRLRFVLMRGIGRAFVTHDYPPSALTATLEAHFA